LAELGYRNQIERRALRRLKASAQDGINKASCPAGRVSAAPGGAGTPRTRQI